MKTVLCPILCRGFPSDIGGLYIGVTKLQKYYTPLMCARTRAQARPRAKKCCYFVFFVPLGYH